MVWLRHGRATVEPPATSGLGVQAVVTLLRVFVGEVAAHQVGDEDLLRAGVPYRSKDYRYDGQRTAKAVANAMSETLRRLEGRGLLRRIRFSGRRGVTTHLRTTEAGKRLADSLLLTVFGVRWIELLKVGPTVYEGFELRQCGPKRIWMPKRPKATCIVCGVVFPKVRHNAVVCGAGCRLEREREKAREQSRRRYARIKAERVSSFEGKPSAGHPWRQPWQQSRVEQ